MSSKHSSSPENLVSMNQAHCQLLVDQIQILQSRIIEMEKSLVGQAAKLHDAIVEKLDRIFNEGTIIEFDEFPGREGIIKISNPGGNSITAARSREVFDTIKATREQLERLNQTIESLQLAR